MLHDTYARRIELRTAERFLIETIMPVGSIHLIGGASGSGKTTWLLEWLYEWSQGKPVMGFKSFPCPFVYISYDRSLLELDRTLRRIGLGDWRFPAYAIEDTGVKDVGDIHKLQECFPEAELFVLEGFQCLLPDVAKGKSQNKTEMGWVSKIREQFLANGKTILGVTHTPKMKTGENFTSSRMRFLGSQSFLASCGTLISLDTPEDKEAGGVHTLDRIVTMTAPNIPDIRLEYTRKANGQFVLITQDSDAEMAMEIWLAERGGEETLTTKQIEVQAAKCGMSRSSVYNWIAARIKDGLMERVGKRGAGTYKRRMMQ